MKKKEYFKVNSIEELEKAYHMFKGKWNKRFSLEDEIYLFNNHGCRYVLYSTFGVYLGDYISNTYNKICSPVKNIYNLNKLI